MMASHNASETSAMKLITSAGISDDREVREDQALADINELANAVRDQQHTEDLWQEPRFQNKIAEGEQPNPVRHLGDNNTGFV